MRQRQAALGGAADRVDQFGGPRDAPVRRGSSRSTAVKAQPSSSASITPPRRSISAVPTAATPAAPATPVSTSARGQPDGRGSLSRSMPMVRTVVKPIVRPRVKPTGMCSPRR
ncbi:hypothetical protein QZN11_38975 [Streptomyces gramineus]|uniref:hypothetical protein n=1 Tax=Streptomyces gramineus TaxID=910542 RepID=UPI00398ADC83